MRQFFLAAFFLFSFSFVRAEELEQEKYEINFSNISASEFIQFVSHVSGMHFIFDDRDLDFSFTLVSGTPVSVEQIMKALSHLLNAHGLSIVAEGDYFILRKENSISKKDSLVKKVNEYDLSKIDDSSFGLSESLLKGLGPRFLIYKLKYHLGNEIEGNIQKIATHLGNQPDVPPGYLNVLKSVQWVKETNCLVCSGDENSLAYAQQLFKQLDIALQQVFIEVLVITTDSRHGTDFGVQWGIGERADNRRGNLSLNLPILNDGMAVFGDLLNYQGKIFSSFNALISALRSDGSSTIVLSQKIVAQDNKPTDIFLGDTIPFTGSVVSVLGAHQQTTSNIEYRDVGVRLTITPRVGDGEMVTLSIHQEITELVPDLNYSHLSQSSGIQSTKTNMDTNVHVPNDNFLILTGMTRNVKSSSRSGIPCLGGISGIGALFGRENKHDDKKTMIIFVRPHIINSAEDYTQITEEEKESLTVDLPEQFLEAIDEK